VPSVVVLVPVVAPLPIVGPFVPLVPVVDDAFELLAVVGVAGGGIRSRRTRRLQ
jgi:hypothetical protein